MASSEKIPIYDDENHEFLGFITEENNSWVAQTIFGYVIERTTSRQMAETIARERGQGYLEGIWQYYDKDDQDWFPCVISDANEYTVTVIRTTVLGFQDPQVYKMQIIDKPTENTLIKSS